MSLLDLNLLQTFVAVAETGGFTSAGQRIHRTQSTVSQQVRRLEDQLGRKLFERDRSTGAVSVTSEGETLLEHARRIIELVGMARDAVQAPDARAIVRLGVPEDFGGRRLTDLLADFARRHPAIRLDTHSAWSEGLIKTLDTGSLDLALIKQIPGRHPRLAGTPELLAWAGAATGFDTTLDPLPLALFPHGCSYRAHAIAAVESMGRRWRIAFESQGLSGVQAAIASGLGIGVLSADAVTPEHRILNEADGFAPLPASELALVGSARRPHAAWSAVATYLVERLGLQKPTPAR